MSLVKATLRATAVKAHTFSPSTIYISYQSLRSEKILPACTSHRCSFSRYATRMHTASKNTGAKADVENKRPNNDNPGSMEVDSRKDVALRHAVRDSQATRADQEAESRFENTLFVKSPVEKDELEDEGEEYDEDKEEARVEAILGFKPKPRIRPKGIRGTDGQNVATEFGSVPQEEEEWRC